MKNIRFIKNFAFGKISESEKSKEVIEIFNDARRRIIEVNLRGGEVLSKHKANEPITVFCLAGSGTFRAGGDLTNEQKLYAGALITLESGVEHEVVAEPEICLLVTKFKAE
jgi:quercetin dioxygenase-like cupin family protein